MRCPIHAPQLCSDQDVQVSLTCVKLEDARMPKYNSHVLTGSSAGRLNPVFDPRTFLINSTGVNDTNSSLDACVFKMNREAHLHFKHFPSKNV